MKIEVFLISYVISSVFLVLLFGPLLGIGTGKLIDLRVSLTGSRKYFCENLVENENILENILGLETTIGLWKNQASKISC